MNKHTSTLPGKHAVDSSPRQHNNGGFLRLTGKSLKAPTVINPLPLAGLAKRPAAGRVLAWELRP
jgi:hypothetical protein